ncbi:TATA box-binding protein-associated factor RNA polymerase I subunit A isoform X1 [Lepisosteus oculatus]|uniref:TATA box-binding protein-associated factor RNA polymerase I subunit A isoform X1 n=2 Tax=Lepisosteus oculatus TaxID=7918 RepID=UPI0035F50336
MCGDQNRNSVWNIKQGDMDDLCAELSQSDQQDSLDDEQQICSPEIGGRPHLPLLHSFKETLPRRETGFHKSSRICLTKIQEALFKHRWEEAAEYMKNYFETLEDTTVRKQTVSPEVIWRMGSEILHHLPNAKLEDFNSFLERLKNIGVKNFQKMCLEHFFHLLLLGKFDDAKRQVSAVENWRYGKLTASQPQTAKLIQAYHGYLGYLTWCALKAAISDTVTDKSDNSDVAEIQEMHRYFRQSSLNLQEILKQPGVWDPFVLGYINMLDFYENESEALKVLNEYAYDNSFPPNPNAHVYLYQFLKKHQASEKTLMAVLRILHALVPSHELMLEFSSLLLKSGESQHLQESVKVIFSLLDYSSWKNNPDAWICLGEIIKLLKKKDCFHFVDEEWKLRKDWWPTFHFSTYLARQDFKENKELFRRKSFVAAAVMENKSVYCSQKGGHCQKLKKKTKKESKKATKRKCKLR